jgi:hypothetical protein
MRIVPRLCREGQSSPSHRPQGYHDTGSQGSTIAVLWLRIWHAQSFMWLRCSPHVHFVDPRFSSRVMFMLAWAPEGLVHPEDFKKTRTGRSRTGQQHLKRQSAGYSSAAPARPQPACCCARRRPRWAPTLAAAVRRQGTTCCARSSCWQPAAPGRCCRSRLTCPPMSSPPASPRPSRCVGGACSWVACSA